MRVHWKIYPDKTETQVFEPEQPARKAILFCPGFPGMGGTIFEQRHAGALAGQGYAVYVIKHRGTRLDTPYAPALVNSSQRLWDARRKNETHLGGGPVEINDWLEEPVAPLQDLTSRYESVYVIGNSFGALSALWSLTAGNVKLDKVRHLLLYAGAQGLVDGTPQDIMRIWRPEYMIAARIPEKVSLGDLGEVIRRLSHVYKLLVERTKALPSHIDLTYLVVRFDEILWLSDTELFQAAIGGRGTIVIDDVDRAYSDPPLLAHDTPDYKTEDLLKLLSG